MTTSTQAYEIHVTDVPPPARTSGGGPGRTRNNPFDEGIQQSYDEKFYEPTDELPEGHWLTFKIDPSMVSRVQGQIRAAAAHLNLGSSFGHAPELDKNKQPTGKEVVWFRGKPREHRHPPAASHRGVLAVSAWTFLDAVIDAVLAGQRGCSDPTERHRIPFL